MLRNYLKIAWRNLWRQKNYATINILGLAVGLACFLLIGLYANHELSYDAFHENNDRIYRLIEYQYSSWTEEHEWRSHSNGLVAPAVREELVGAETAVRMRSPRSIYVSYQNEHFQNQEHLYAEPSFFDIFSFELIEGDPQTALQRPHTVVLTETLAARVFGGEPALGRQIDVPQSGETQPFEVTGIVQDPPSNSHLSFDLLFSFESLLQTRIAIDNSQFYTYLLLPEEATTESVEPQLLGLYDSQNIGREQVKDVQLEPLADVYFSEYSAPNAGSPRTLYVLGAIALAVLLIACANYVNLATAQATRRRREVGVRKAMGAWRTQLAGQFLAESLLLCLLALPLALLFLRGAVPLFNQVAGTGLSFAVLGEGTYLVGLLGLLVLIGLLAGAYPALYLTRFDAGSVLHGRGASGRGGAHLRKGLVAFQFAASVALIACTAIIWQQLRYAQTMDLGFDEEHVVMVYLPTEELRRQHEVIKQAFTEHLGVVRAAAASAMPTGYKISMGVRPDPSREDLQLTFLDLVVDHDFVEMMGLRLGEGRDFSRGRPADATEATILNETAVRELGWDDPVGRTISFFKEGHVIGVVEDFHFDSIHNSIEPVALRLNRWGRMDDPQYMQIAARLRGENLGGALAHMRETWNEIAPDQPFDYRFLDEQIAAEYEEEQHAARIVGAFGGLAVFLACLGLFGLAAFAAERRRQEIGIRKVLGATAQSIVALLSKDFLKLVLIGFALAVPVAYYAMQRWLEDFAYRIDIGPGVFVAAGVAALVIALATVSYQALRAAWTNPAEAIRNE